MFLGFGPFKNFTAKGVCYGTCCGGREKILQLWKGNV